MRGFAISFLTLARVALLDSFLVFLCSIPHHDVEIEAMQSHFAQLRNMPPIAEGRLTFGPARSRIAKCCRVEDLCGRKELVTGVARRPARHGVTCHARQLIPRKSAGLTWPCWPTPDGLYSVSS